jgi:hypothetical protein
MKTRLLFGVAAVFICGAAAVGGPLKVVSTSPEFWAAGVNPASQKTVSLTFDEPIRLGFTDWFGLDVLSPSSNLKTTVTPDRKTCSINVQLQPGKVYICALNERGIPGVGFQSENGTSLAPTYLVFQTSGPVAPADAPPRVLATSPQSAAQHVDPTKLTSISVTFDKPMRVAKHGLQMIENKNVVDLSKARFQYSADGKSFALVYPFRPSSSYEVTLNSTENIGFTSTTRIPLWPVRFAFTTGPAQ